MNDLNDLRVKSMQLNPTVIPESSKMSYAGLCLLNALLLASGGTTP